MTIAGDCVFRQRALPKTFRSIAGILEELWFFMVRFIRRFTARSSRVLALHDRATESNEAFREAFRITIGRIESRLATRRLQHT